MLKIFGRRQDFNRSPSILREIVHVASDEWNGCSQRNFEERNIVGVWKISNRYRGNCIVCVVSEELRDVADLFVGEVRTELSALKHFSIFTEDAVIDCEGNFSLAHQVDNSSRWPEWVDHARDENIGVEYKSFHR